MTHYWEFFNMESFYVKRQFYSMKSWMVIVVMLKCVPGISQIDGNTMSIISLTALGYQESQDYVFSSANIIAAAPKMKNAQIGIYGENRFMLKQLTKFNCALVVPKQRSAFAIQAVYQGMSLMNFTGIDVGYGMELGKMMSAGIKIESGSIKFPVERKKYMIGYQAGTILKASEKTHLGIHITSRYFLSRKKMNDQLTSYTIHTGIGHQINKNLYLCLEINKIKDMQVFLMPYLRWTVGENVQLHLGTSEPLNTGYLGIGWTGSKKNIMFSAASHPQLGFSGSISFCHKLNG